MNRLFTKVSTLVLGLFLSSQYTIAQTFTSAEYEKALWMTTRFYGGQRIGENNWFLQGHKPTALPSDVSNVTIPESSRGKCYIGEKDAGYDIEGGWFDAGDNILFGETQFYSAYMLLKAYAEFPQGYDDYYSFDYKGYIAGNNWTWEGKKGVPNDIPDILDEVKHATDFFIKAAKDNNTFYYQKGKFQQDHKYWVTAVTNTYLPANVGGMGRLVQKNPKGASMASFCGATLALMARVYAKYDQAYADLCLTHAKYAYAYAKANPGTQGGSGAYGANNNWKDDYATMCAELFWATGNASYKNEVMGYQVGKDNYEGKDVYFNYSFDYSNNGEIAMYNLALLGHSTAKSVLNTVVTSHYKATTTNGIYQGGNTGWGPVRYNANSALIVAFNQKLQNNGVLPTSASQIDKYILDNIDWILGKNTQNTSFIVGFSSNTLPNAKSPQYPHHRNVWLIDNNPMSVDGKSIPEKNKQAGIMVGGNRTAYVDNPSKFEHSEGGIDYNACLVGALAYIRAVMSPVDTNKFNAGQKPNLGEDQTICGVSEITLNSQISTDGVKEFTWYRNDTELVKAKSKTGNTLKITKGGKYTVILDSLNEWSTRSSVVISETLPTISLGNNFELCTPAFVTLDAKVSGNGITYQWERDNAVLKEAGKTLMVRKAGTYALTISASNCQSKYAEVVVSSLLPEVIDGGICNGKSTTLEIVADHTNFAWYADTSSNTPIKENSKTLTVSQKGTYYVEDKSSFSLKTGPAYGSTDLKDQNTNNGSAKESHLKFEVISGFTLNSVSFDVMSWGAESGTITIAKDGTTLSGFPKTFQIGIANNAPVKVVAQLDVYLEPGNYTMEANKILNFFEAPNTKGKTYNDLIKIVGPREDMVSWKPNNYGGYTDWDVTAGNACGRIPVLAIDDCITSSKEIETYQSSSITPNPSNSNFQINSNENIISVQIINIDGSLESNFIYDGNTFGDQLKTGTYIVKIVSENKVETITIVKQ